MSLTLAMLGNSSIEYNGVKIGFRLRKAEALIYYLALNGSAARDELKAIFWQDKDEARASANLRNAIYLINEAMPGALVTNKRRVSLTDCASDLDAIQEICNPNVPLPPALFQTPLKDISCSNSLSFCEWLDGERHKIRSSLLELLHKRITAAYETHDGYAIKESLEAVLRLDPCDEDSVLELMEHYRITGQTAKAVETYKNFTSAIKSAYGVESSERVRDYYARLLPGSAAASETAKFWCRENELSSVKNTLRQNTGKNVVFVHGEAGIGKTALINKALETPADCDTVILSSKGIVTGEDYDYSSWNNIVVTIGEIIEKNKITLPRRSVSILSGIFPSFMKEEHFSFNADIAMMTEINPITLSMIIAELLRRISAKVRVMLVLEDVHRFDIRSVELIEALLSVINCPIKIIISSRPESVKYITSMLRRADACVTDIELRPFTRDEILYISRSVLPQSTVEGKGAAYFISESEGLPLMLFEMLRSLQENPQSDCSKGLGSMIMERIDRLSEKERVVLRALAVCKAGSPNIISEVAELSVNETAQAAEVLVAKGLIEEHSKDKTPFWCFTHQKLREYIYNSISLSSRQELHRKVGSALEKRYSPRIWDPELSAAIRRHYTQAGDLALELKQYLRELVFDVTLNHDVFPTLHDKLLLSCSAPFSSRSETEKKISKVLAILNELRYSGASNGGEYASLEATCFEIIGDYMISWGDYAKGITYINESLAVAKKNNLLETRIYCLKHLIYMYLQTENTNMLIKTSRELVYAAKAANMPQYLATAVRYIGIAYSMRLNFELAEKIFLHSINLFERLKITCKDYSLGILVAKCCLGEIYQRRGEAARAASLLAECCDACEKINLYWGRSYFLAVAADIALDRGDMKSFFEYVDKGVGLFESYKGGRCGYKLYSLKAIADIERRDFLGARQAMAKAEIMIEAANRKEGIALYHLAKAWDIEREAGERRIEASAAIKLYKQIGHSARAKWIHEKLLA